jgi:cystathionine beta-lyase
VEPTTRFDDLSLDELRTRRSVKWRRYPDDVLPAWVAELDFPLAAPVHRALADALARDDTGYANADGLPAAFASFAAARWRWDVDPQRMLLVADIMSGVGELLRALTAPGDGVVVNPPVYAPFFMATREAGRRIVHVPLVDGRVDPEGLERAFADGATAYLLCHPHNPVGRTHERGELEAIAALADRYGVTVISDEVHAPMTLPGSTHVPYLTVGDGVCVTSASKTWNLAGLKCAVIVAGSESMHATLNERIPPYLGAHASLFGVLAATAAFDHGDEWLDALLRHLDRNRALLGELLEEHLPDVGYVPPQAGYLAWLDCSELGLGIDPADAFLERGRVALGSGPTFGEQGRGCARLNFGTSGALLEEAVRRMALAAREP